ncbi:uncharacterized protein TM35_000731080 [Trypanosoma theileri]|uniref:Uncharacterized protein n=1 Tax=Trypanosoma theileri TaxID=67003 RepID=A0A1X0NF67_9TRYP|nr:uncharacterized protein TM35_000731080 [Trypanosoma theileri]ORC83384.1 hypothetical protein TM35_000731080 [Trypanosoma theileri]
MEANAFTNEPNGTAADGDFKCTSGNSGTCTVTGDVNVFTALLYDRAGSGSSSDGSSSSGSSSGSPAREAQGYLQAPVLPTQEVTHTQDSHPTNLETSSRQEQDAGNSRYQEELKPAADSQPTHDGRGGESTSDTSSAAQVDRSNNVDGAITTTEQNQIPPSNPPTQGNPGSSNNTVDNTTTGDSNPTEQASPAEASTTNATHSQENGNADSTATTTNTTTEAPTTTTISCTQRRD